jgi:hypothetical protein
MRLLHWLAVLMLLLGVDTIVSGGKIVRPVTEMAVDAGRIVGNEIAMVVREFTYY